MQESIRVPIRCLRSITFRYSGAGQVVDLSWGLRVLFNYQRGKRRRTRTWRPGETARKTTTPAKAELPDMLVDGPAGPRTSASVRAVAYWTATSNPRGGIGLRAPPSPGRCRAAASHGRQDHIFSSRSCVTVARVCGGPESKEGVSAQVGRTGPGRSWPGVMSITRYHVGRLTL